MADDYTILALDLATVFGWAVGTRGGGISSSGSVRLPSGHIEDKVAAFMRWLSDFYRVTPCHHLICEAALPASHFKGKTRIETTQLLMTLPSVAGGYFRLMRVPMDRIRRAEPNDVRRHFIGQTRAEDRNATKRAVISRCRQLGFDPADDNEADAIALFDYQRALLNARYSAASGPLFTAT